VSSGMLRREALVKTDVSEEPSASFIRVTRIGELGITLAATSNRRTLRRNVRRFLQESHGVISQKTPLFKCDLCLGNLNFFCYTSSICNVIYIYIYIKENNFFKKRSDFSV
jgi:hypothetical protein